MQAHVENRLIEIINPLIASLGYEVVHVEIQTHRTRTLRLFIDFAEAPAPDASGETPGIGIEDCVKVTKALDEPLDQSTEIEGIFHGAYELEVSSPGVDRPLRQKKDYERFAGRQIRLHTFRALSSEEIGNANYFSKNPKQKNFIGVLKGLDGERILLGIGDSGGASQNKKGKKAKAKAEEIAGGSGAEIKIPLSLISKANLEPQFEFPD